MPDLAWFPRVLPLAGWAHVGGGPHQSPKGCPACPTPHPRPCCFRWRRGRSLHIRTRDPEPGLTQGCSGQAARHRRRHLHV